MTDAIEALGALLKGGPFIGPRGGRYKDAARKIPWRDDEPTRKTSVSGVRARADRPTKRVPAPDDVHDRPTLLNRPPIESERPTKRVPAPDDVHDTPTALRPPPPGKGAEPKKAKLTERAIDVKVQAALVWTDLSGPEKLTAADFDFAKRMVQRKKGFHLPAGMTQEDIAIELQQTAMLHQKNVQKKYARKSMDAIDRLEVIVKGAGGWGAIPNGKKGGQRKRTGKGYTYRYPDGKGGWKSSPTKGAKKDAAEIARLENVKRLGKDRAAVGEIAKEMSRSSAHSDMQVASDFYNALTRDLNPKAERKAVVAALAPMSPGGFASLEEKIGSTIRSLTKKTSLRDDEKTHLQKLQRVAGHVAEAKRQNQGSVFSALEDFMDQAPFAGKAEVKDGLPDGGLRATSGDDQYQVNILPLDDGQLKVTLEHRDEDYAHGYREYDKIAPNAAALKKLLPEMAVNAKAVLKNHIELEKLKGKQEASRFDALQEAAGKRMATAAGQIAGIESSSAYTHPDGTQELSLVVDKTLPQARIDQIMNLVAAELVGSSDPDPIVRQGSATQRGNISVFVQPSKAAAAIIAKQNAKQKAQNNGSQLDKLPMNEAAWVSGTTGRAIKETLGKLAEDHADLLPKNVRARGLLTTAWGTNGARIGGIDFPVPGHGMSIGIAGRTAKENEEAPGGHKGISGFEATITTWDKKGNRIVDKINSESLPEVLIGVQTRFKAQMKRADVEKKSKEAAAERAHAKRSQAERDAEQAAAKKQKTTGGLSKEDPLEAWRKKKAEMDKKSMGLDAIDGLEALVKGDWVQDGQGWRPRDPYFDDPKNNDTSIASPKKGGGGWAAAPGSKKGAQRKRSGKGYTYRYPDGKGGWSSKKPGGKSKRGGKYTGDFGIAGLNKDRRDFVSNVEALDALLEDGSKKKGWEHATVEGVAGAISGLNAAISNKLGSKIEQLSKVGTPEANEQIKRATAMRAQFRSAAADAVERATSKAAEVTGVDEKSARFTAIQDLTQALKHTMPMIEKNFDLENRKEVVALFGNMMARGWTHVYGGPRSEHSPLKDYNDNRVATMVREAIREGGSPKLAAAFNKHKIDGRTDWSAKAVGKKSMDAIDGLEALSKGEMKGKYVGARLADGMHGMKSKKKKGNPIEALIGKMKRAGVPQDVTQLLIGKMKSQSGDVTQRLIGMCSNARKSVLDPITLAKSMYEFTDEKNMQPLPENLLPQYLAAFVEEAYEHEKRECEHQQNKPAGQDDQLTFFARRVMNELVMAMRKNKDLMRAAKGVTTGTIENILRGSGLIQPDVSGYSNPAGNGLEPMAYSHDAKRPAQLVAAEQGGFIDDTEDPFQTLQKAQAAQHRNVWRVREHDFIAKGRGDCPIHGHRDLTKMMNLANTHGKCTCS